MEGLSMYCTQKSMSEIFDVSSTFVTHLCRLIDDYEDRYENLGKIGGRYSAVAFADAYVYHKDMEEQKSLPPFRPDIIKKFLAEPNDETKRDYYEFGFNEAWHSIYDDVKEYFDTTQVPVESEEVVRAIRNGVLSAIVNVTEG